MAYSVVADIQNEFKDTVFSSTTAVTDDDVEDFITSADAVINGYLSSKYVVPFLDATSLAIMKMISIWLVKARILSILSVKAPQTPATQDPDGPSLYKQAMNLLKNIKDGTLQLPDATLISSQDGLTSFLMNEDVSYDFHRQENDW